MGFIKVSKRLQINAVAFKEGDAWVAQGIEYDIVAHVGDFQDIPDAFSRAVMENICITEHLGRSPLAGIDPAPRHFQEMFDAARVELTSTRPEKPSLADVKVRVAA